MDNLFEIKQLVIAHLVGTGEYALEEATQYVNEATIGQEGNLIKVTYKNGVEDYYEIIKTLKYIEQ